MADEKMKNPYMEMYAVWEKMMADSLDTMLRSPAFVANVAKTFENFMVSKEQIDKSVQATLRAMNLPSTKDIADVLDALGSLRLAVDELQGKVDGLLQQASQEGGMRSRQRPRVRNKP